MATKRSGAATPPRREGIAKPDRADDSADVARPAQAPADAALRQAIAALGAELVAVRGRLATLEAADGGTTSRVGGPAASLTDLRRRVAALERRAGIVPGLVPLPGCEWAARPAGGDIGVPPPAATPPRARPHAWLARGRA